MISRLNVIWILLWQNFTPRNRRDRLRLLWVFLDPIGQIAILMLVFEFMGRTPGYGRSFAVFLVTGVAMLSLFNRLGGLVRGAVIGLGARNRLPGIGLLHEALARTGFMAIVAACYTAVLLWVAGQWYNVEVTPAHPATLAVGFVATLLLALGVGLVRGYAAVFAPSVDRIYGILSRGLLFISGVFYVPSFMPPQIRDLVVWNPVLHCIDLFRLGFYAEYPTITFSADFLLTVILGLNAMGCALLWRRRAEIMG